MEYGFLIDTKKCTSCKECVDACQSEHQIPDNFYRIRTKSVPVTPYPNANNWTTVLLCNQCQEAPCVSICPTTALYKRPDGIIEFEDNECIGCKACMLACPYDALFINPETKTAQKCNTCTHRVDQGLLPACVEACPEKAIFWGDTLDEKSEISLSMAANPFTVRKPEKGTVPKVHYINSDDRLLRASELSNESTVPQLKKVLWGWKVSGFVLTKAIASGMFLMLFLAYFANHMVEHPFFSIREVTVNAGIFMCLVFISISALLLTSDLTKPQRFFRVLTKPQWNSWLVIGAYSLLSFFILVLILYGTMQFRLNTLFVILIYPTALSAIMVSIYTAYLLAQAKGRDFWQNPSLAFHMLIHSFMAGAATYDIVGIFYYIGEGWGHYSDLVMKIAIFANLLILLFELSFTQTSSDANAVVKMITRGEFKNSFIWLVVIAGNIIPFLLLVFIEGRWSNALAGLGVLVGIFITEKLWIQAPQKVPLS